MLKNLKSSLNHLKTSKDSRVVVSNFGYLTLLKITGYIFPLLTIPYLAKTIGVEGFGKIAFATGVIVWFQTISDWGFNYTATRDVARCKNDIEAVSKIFSNVLWSRILLAAFCLFLLNLCIYLIPYFNQNKQILLVTFLLIPGNILFPEWFFQAMERMKFITIFNLASKALFTLLVFIFIKEKEDFILQPLFISLGYMISGIAATFIIFKDWKIKLYKPNQKHIKKTIQNSTDVFINNAMPNLYNSLAVVLLGHWWGSFANGIYDAGRKLILIIHSFMDIFIRATFPLFSRKMSAHDLFAKTYLLLSLLASLLVFLVSPYFIKLLFTTEFSEAIVVMKISSISIFLIALSKVYGTNYLILQGYEKTLRNITFISSLVGFIISLPLVYFYSFKGAAITLILVQAIIGFWTMIQALKIKKYKAEFIN